MKNYDDVTRRDVVRALGIGGAAAIAGCTDGESTGNDETTTDDPDSTDDTTETTETTTTEQPLEGTARIALSTDPTAGPWAVYGGVTPYFTNILEPLIWVTDDMKLKPWLATDWESTGEKTWEFTLREGVKFHNGKEFNADAVVFSFEAVLNEWAWAPGWLHVKPDNVTKVDEYTVEFETTNPFPTFPGTIAHNMVAMQHPDRNRKQNEIIGTGPLQVESFEKNQNVKTTTFDDYWAATPKLDQIDFKVITDPNTRALSLEGDEVDVAYGPPRSKISNMKSSDSLGVATQLSPTAGYLGINIYNSPLDDVDLRKGLNYAVDQELIVSEVLNGIGVPAKGPIAESIYWSAHEKLPSYGPDKGKAKDLIDQSSYSGQDLKIYVSNNMVDGRLLAQVLQQSFKEVDVNASIKMLEESAYDDAVRNGEADLILTESGTNSGAADYIIYETFHSEGDVNQRLYNEEDTGLYNLGGEVDELISQGFQTADKAEKERVYEQALEKVMDKGVIVPLYYDEYVVAHRNDVSNLDLRPIPEMVRWEGLVHTK